jgi:hypothetical protein
LNINFGINKDRTIKQVQWGDNCGMRVNREDEDEATGLHIHKGNRKMNLQLL